MSQDDYDIDLNDLGDEEIQVERIGTQKNQEQKEHQREKQKQKTAAAAQAKKQQKAAAAAAQQQSQQSQSQTQQTQPSNLRRIDEAFKSTQQQKSVQANSGGFDIDAALGSLKTENDDNNNNDLVSSLLQGSYDDDEDDDGSNQELDINAILGLAPKKEEVNADHDDSMKNEDDADAKMMNSSTKHQHKTNFNQAALEVKKEKAAAALAAVKTDPDAAAPTSTAKQQQQQNYSVASAPEMKFASNVKLEDIKIKQEVEYDATGAVDDATVVEVSSSTPESNMGVSPKKLPPAISPEERRGKIPTVQQLQQTSTAQILRNVYWFDAKEASSHDPSDLAGQVILFGRIACRENEQTKVSTYRSICVRVPMVRCVLFLPKNNNNNSNGIPQEQKNAGIMEVNNLCKRRGDFGQKTFKWVKRRYAFEEAGVPTEETDWLKLKYSAAHPPLWGTNDNVPQLQNFSHVFGVNRSPMELLFIKRRFEGPGFLDITNASAVPQAKRRSICQFEFVCTSQKDVFDLSGTSVRGIPPPPDLTAAAICLRTQLDSSAKNHLIYAATLATCRFNTEASTPTAPLCQPFIGVRQWSNDASEQLPFDLIKQGLSNNLGNIKTFKEEKDLVKWLLDLIRAQDPDIIIGHNIVGFSLGLLFSRIDELHIPRTSNDWSSFGRMHWKQVPRQLIANKGKNDYQGSSSYWEKELCAGRLLVDTYTLSREHHRTSNYKLLALAAELQLSGIFGEVTEAHAEQPVELLTSTKMKDASVLLKILAQDYNFALLCVRLTHKLGMIPLTKRLTTVAGTVWSRVLNGSRAERIEYLLMHRFHRLKFVTPDKSGLKQRLALQAQAQVLEKQEREREEREAAAAAAAAANKNLDENAAPAGAEDGSPANKKSGGVRRQRGGVNARTAAAANAVAAAADAAFEGGDDDDGITGVNQGDADDEDDLMMMQDAAGGNSTDNTSSSNANLSTGAQALATTAKKAAKYKGGMVLDPLVGLYRDYVLLLDFNSLYPSLIQEFNVCFTTVDRLKGAAALRDRNEPQIPSRDALICETCIKLPNAEKLYPCPHRCILPKVIRELVEGRRAVRRQMKFEKNPSNLAQMEIRQKALKLTANSMYGCLGFENSRFYAQKLAELVTLQGRTALQKTVDIVTAAPGNISVVYGDTDSVMISTQEYENLDNVKRIAATIQKEVNKRYTHLELGMDGVFRSLLLHKKKKYAALTVTDWESSGKTLKQEVKGLEMVRRDWCKLSKQACDLVLKTALDPRLTDEEEVVETIGDALEKIADSVLNGKEPLTSFVIAKSIQRNPKDYKDAGSQPHVQVALRMQEKKLPVFVGDLIPYVICIPPDQQQKQNQQQEGETEEEKKKRALTEKQAIKQLAQRAFSEDEAKTQKLQIDAEWYLANQLYPPVLRLCEHINGFTPEFLVSKLKITKASVGIQEQQANRRDQNKNNADAAAAASRPAFAPTFKGMALEEAYSHVLPLEIRCPICDEVHKQEPHTRAAEILNKKHHRFGRRFPRPDLESSPPVRLRWMNQVFNAATKQNEFVLARVPWFYCSNATCKVPFFDPGIVENAIAQYLDRAVQTFYSAPNARSEAKYKTLLDQISYIQRLIEIPSTALDPAEKDLWSQAARYKDGSGYWRSAAEVLDAQKHSGKAFTNEEIQAKLNMILQSKLVGQEALSRFLPLVPALKIDLGAEFFGEEEE